jgi:hypothetical protein
MGRGHFMSKLAQLADDARLRQATDAEILVLVTRSATSNLAETLAEKVWSLQLSAEKHECLLLTIPDCPEKKLLSENCAATRALLDQMASDLCNRILLTRASLEAQTSSDDR